MPASLTIVHLERDPQYRALVAETVAREGVSHRLVPVSDRAALLAALEQGPVRLVLADSALLDAETRGDLGRRFPGMPVILTGVLSEGEALPLIREGVADYLPKDNPARLAIALVRSLGGLDAKERRSEGETLSLKRLTDLMLVAQEVLAASTLEEVLQRVIDAARLLLGCNHATAMSGYSDENFYTVTLSSFEAPNKLPQGSMFRVAKGGVYLRLMQDAGSIRFSDAELRSQPDWCGLPEWHLKLRGLVGAALTGAAGEPIGLAMATDKLDGSDFSAEDEVLFRQLAAVASLGLQHIQAREESLRQRDAVQEKQKACEELTEQLALALKAGRSGTFDWNLLEDRVVWSDEIQELYGVNRPTFRAGLESWLAFVLPEDRERFAADIDLALRTGEYAAEFRIVHQGAGGVRWMHARGQVLRDPEGKRVRFIGINVDVTERKRAEEMLCRSERRFAAAFGASPDALVVSGADGTILEVNDAFLKLLGWSRDELPHGSTLDLYAEPAERGRMAARLQREGKLTDYEMRIRRRDGQELVTLLCSQTLQLDEGEASLSILRDVTRAKAAEQELHKVHQELEQRVKERTIELATTVEILLEEITERRKAEEALQAETVEKLRTMEELREKDRMLMQQSRQAAMGEMIGNIAHQWRQPLNVLALMLQSLTMQYELGECTLAYLESVEEKGMQIIQHMSQTINDFRNYFKPDKEKVLFRAQDAVNRTISLLEDSFRCHNIAIEVQSADDPVINGYQNEFGQVLLNILNNAKDAYVDRGTKAPRRVEIRLESEEGRAVVVITDNAGGIADELLGKIFEPYFTTKGPDKGTGVGLFMSKSIIEKNMGGRLTACNVASGARFRIEV